MHASWHITSVFFLHPQHSQMIQKQRWGKVKNISRSIYNLAHHESKTRFGARRWARRHWYTGEAHPSPGGGQAGPEPNTRRAYIYSYIYNSGERPICSPHGDRLPALHTKRRSGDPRGRVYRLQKKASQPTSLCLPIREHDPEGRD